MIHKAQALIHTPGKSWAGKLQAKRNEIESAVRLVGRERVDVSELVDAHLACGGRFKPRDVAIKSLDGRTVDDGSGLEYEFVAFNRELRKIIIAVFIGDGDAGSPIRFAELFPNMRRREVFDSDLAFLVVPAIRGFQRGWALQPTGKDRHDSYGFDASPRYLKRLLQAAQ